MKKLILLSSIVLASICVAFIPAKKRKILIDVSHGGKDYGVQHEHWQEKEITLSIALRIKELNNDPNLDIILSRAEDRFMGLDERVTYFNEEAPDKIISLHVNASPDKQVNGTEIFISNKHKTNALCADWAQTLKTHLLQQKAEIKEKDLYLLHQSQHPIALVELGYLSNQKDRAFLTSEDGQKQIAQRLLNAMK